MSQEELPLKQRLKQATKSRVVRSLFLTPELIAELAGHKDATVTVMFSEQLDGAYGQAPAAVLEDWTGVELQWEEER